MSEKILQLNDGIIRNELKKLVRNSVEGTLNDLLEKEAKETDQRGEMRTYSYHTAQNIKNEDRILSGLRFGFNRMYQQYQPCH